MTGTADVNPERARTRTVWLVFAPLFAVLLLRFVLGTWAESLPDAQPLRAVHALDDADVGAVMWQAVLPVLLTLAAAAALLLMLWSSVRVWGWRRVAPRLLALWLAACAAAAVALALQYLNRAALQPLPEVTATVVQARPYPSSERGPGGAMTVLMLPHAAEMRPPRSLASHGALPPEEAAPPWERPGGGALRRALLRGADARALPPGHALRLSLARGRFWGEYVTASDAPAAPRAGS
jgi:hypothetical protein